MAGSVSKKTDYESPEQKPARKLDKAREVGVSVIDENEMKKLLKGA